MSSVDFNLDAETACADVAIADRAEAVRVLDSLLFDARRGHRESLGQLLQLFVPALTRMAERLMSPELQVRMGAGDLVQETLVSASREFSGFRGRTAVEFRAWLVQHFHSRLVDGIRRHRLSEKRRIDREERLADSTIPDRSAMPGDLSDGPDEIAALIRAISGLPSELRQIVLLHYRDQLSFHAIGESLGLSAATVWRRWTKALQILKGRLTDCGF